MNPVKLNPPPAVAQSPPRPSLHSQVPRRSLGKRWIPVKFIYPVLAFAVVLAACDLLDPAAQDAAGPTVPPSEAPPVASIDREPNNRPAQSSELTNTGTGRITQGDVDYYRWAGEPGIWRIDLQPEIQGALRLDILSSDDPIPEELQPITTVMAADLGPDTSIVIRPVGPFETPYTLLSSPADIPAGWQVLAEPNDIEAPLVIGELPARAVGYFDGSQDRDALIVATALLRRSNATTIEISPVPGVRPVMRLLTPQRVLLAEVAAQQAGAGTGIPNVGPPETLTDLLVEVADASGAGSLYPYTVSLYPLTLDAGLVELEPNDTREYAGRLVGASQLAGFFHTAQDRDVFRLNVPADGSITIIATPDPLTDLGMNVGSDGTASFSLDFRGPGDAELLCSRYVARGDYFIEVGPRQASGAGLATYTLDVRVERPDVEREPNDTIAPELAQPIDLAVRGYVFPESDVDIFAWRLIPVFDTSGEKRIEVRPPAEVDVALEILDDEGLQVAVADRAGSGESERITVGDLPAATYRIIVRGRGGARCDESYTLSIQ